MIEQLKTIREALLLRDMEACEEALTALTQLEAMVGKREPVAFVNGAALSRLKNGESVPAYNCWGSPWPTPLYAAPVAQQPQAEPRKADVARTCPFCNEEWVEQPQAEPDAHCITTPDGGCISTDPRCMHQPQAEAVPVVDRVYEAAKRLVDHADFQLGGVLSAKSKARDIPSNAASKVKARHLASLRDALAKTPQQAEAVPPGYVLVPEEPTEAMLKAASRACEGRLYPADMRHGPRAQNSDRYRAMIAAAIAQQKGGV